jgi:hypothetical protein
LAIRASLGSCGRVVIDRALIEELTEKGRSLWRRVGEEMAEMFEVPGNDDEPALNVLRANTTPDESAIWWGGYERSGRYRRSRTTARTREQVIETQPGMVENWLAVIKIVSNGLIGTTIVLAVMVLLACVASILRSIVGSY